MAKISQLDEPKGILRILLSFLLVEEDNQDSIAKRITNGDHRIVRASLTKLKELDIITSRIDESEWPYRKMWRLTPHGRKVAAKLKEIEDLL